MNALKAAESIGRDCYRIFGGIEVTVKISGSVTDGSLAIFECRFPDGALVPPHVHFDVDETFYVLEGEFRFQVDRQVQRVRTGGCVYIPRGIPHSIEFIGPGSGRLLLISAPAKVEQWLEELGAIEEASAGIVSVLQVSGRYGTEIIPRSAA